MTFSLSLCVRVRACTQWSRYSGGSGAPGWTFEIAGLDIRAFKETGAAYVHNTNAVPGDPLPMVSQTPLVSYRTRTWSNLRMGE